MLQFKLHKYDIEFLGLGIYITSKMLWDCVPYVFEISFWVIVVWNAFIYLLESIRKDKNTYLIVLVVCIGIYILMDSLMFDSIHQFMRSIYEYIIYMLILFFFMRLKNKINLILCLKVLSDWGALIALLTWIEYARKQYLLTDLSAYGVILYVGNNGFRAAVFTRSFLSHGIVLGVFSVISLFLWYRLKYTGYLFKSVFCYAAILATGSRGPLVSFFCAIVFFFYIETFKIKKRKNTRIKFAIAIAIGIGILLFILTLDVNPADSSIAYFIYRIQNIFNWTGDAGNTGRVLIWNNAINNWFKKAPIFGIGPSKTGSWGNGSLGVTESGLLKRLCELGIIGFALFYGLIAYILKNSMRTAEKTEMAFWIAIFIGIFVNDITVQSTEEIMVSYWWWCSLGAIYSLKLKKNKLAH